jgi:hypothetical protein
MNKYSEHIRMFYMYSPKIFGTGRCVSMCFGKEDEPCNQPTINNTNYCEQCMEINND